MKNILYKVNFWNLFIGIAIGIGVGVYLLNAFVPNANQLVAMYRANKVSETAHMETPHVQASGNPYVMAKITSEKQFVQQMKLHHEAAVLMAQQVLALSPRADIKDLAQDIVSSQSTEIKVMKDWLATWK
jgi:uncharacterized protein (DUF305 family)